MKVKMSGFKINSKEIDKKITNSREFKERTRDIVNKKLQKAKEELMREFNSHPVTQELQSGPAGANASGLLGGYRNLFSFMGFKSGSNPVEAVRLYLRESIKIKQGKSRGKTIEFLINTPTLEDFNFAKMPWESGNSWIVSIERGMSSFSYYMHKAYQASRAGVGMQIDHKLRGKSSAPTKYMSSILNNFRKRLTK